MADPSGEEKPSLRPRNAGLVVKPQRKRQGSPFRMRALLRFFMWIFVLGVLVASMSIAGLVWYYGRDLPSVAKLKNYEPLQVTRIVDRNNALIDEIYTERRTVVPLTKVPRVLILSVLAAEDADFYRHEGLDYPGLLRAVARSVITGRRISGTSTITQQIVKNLILSPERSIARKVKELLLARRLEQQYSKDEILTLYLNTINYGHGRYGVEEGSLYYFGKHVGDLTLAEASLMAGVPQAPTYLSPRTHPEAARRRQMFVLGQLQKKRAQYWPDLPIADIQAAIDRPVALAPPHEEGENAPEIVSLVRSQLTQLVGADALKKGGFVVHTTLDLAMQKAARDSLQNGLTKIDLRRGTKAPFRAPAHHDTARYDPKLAPLVAGRTYDAIVAATDDASNTIELSVEGRRGVANLAEHARFNPQHLPPSRFIDRGVKVRAFVDRAADPSEPDSPASVHIDFGPEGAVIVIDPRTRDVLALVGGYEMRSGFDRALSAVRQPGSSFKPIVYGAAIQSRKYTPATLVLDAPGVFDQYKPQNFETWTSQGAVRLREALAQSINLVAVRVTQDIGPPAVVELAQKLGISTMLDPSLALALGASAVKPIELVNAYATFAAAGVYATPRFISRIETASGKDVVLPEVPAPREVLTAAEAYVVTSMMTSVVDHGTAVGAKKLERPVAGKTGTSNEARDTWFVGFTADLVCGVWVGFDDERSLGKKESGAKAALPIWVDTMLIAERNRPVVEFPVPSGINTVRIDPASGSLAPADQENAIEEIFLEGTEPREVAVSPDALDTANALMEQLTGTKPALPSEITPTPSENFPEAPAH